MTEARSKRRVLLLVFIVKSLPKIGSSLPWNVVTNIRSETQGASRGLAAFYFYRVKGLNEWEHENLKKRDLQFVSSMKVPLFCLHDENKFDKNWAVF